MKIITAMILIFWSIQSHAITFVPYPSSYQIETAKGTIIGITAILSLMLFVTLFFKTIEYVIIYSLSDNSPPLNFSTALEDYKDEELKSLDSKILKTIYFENTAWNKEVPCMYASYKLDLIKQELISRGEKIPW